MRKVLVTLLMLAFAMFPLVAMAQDAVIKGTVTDQEGEPLMGANVYLEGTALGTAAGQDGIYLFSVPAALVTGQEMNLVARFMGYKTQQRTIQLESGTIEQDFTLETDVLRFDEIVVTGTGYDLKKKELASPVTTIDAAEIAMAPVQSIDELLQARVTGGNINLNSGQPGSGSRMRVRGVNSATVSQTPVIYVDGVRVDNADNYRLENFTGGLASNSISDVLVGDVERVEVIKGGAAATLYGSEAANGVIQIFTKKGKAGAPVWRFNLEGGVDMPETKFILEDFTKDYVLKNGPYQKYSASVDGGTSGMTYHLSAHMKQSIGVTDENSDRRWGMQAGFRAFPLENLQIDFSGGFTRHQFERTLSNNAIAGVLSTIESHDYAFFNEDMTDADRADLLELYLAPQNDEFVNRATFGTTVKYDPLDLLTTRFTVGVDYRKSEQRYFIPIKAEGVTSTPGGGLERADRAYMTLTLDWAATLRYPQEGPLTSNLTVGAQGFRVEDRESDVDATEFGLPGTDDFDNAANLDPHESNREIFSGGFYVNEQLGLLDKLFLNLGARFDGNTAFGDEVSLVAYPKAGLAYNISDEGFWPLGDWVSPVKLRASYGQTGAFPPPFQRDKSFAQGSFLGAVAAQFDNPGDPNLKPEKTTTIEAGVDMALWNERVAVEFTWFNDKTTDALFSVPSQPSTGLGAQLRNVGTIENTGIELAASVLAVNMPNVKVSIGGSFSTLDNEVTSLGGSVPFNIGGFSFLPLRIEEGHPVGVFQTNEPIPDENGELTGDYTPNQLLNSPIATKLFGAHLNITLFKNLRIRAYGDGQAGGYILNTGAVLRYFNGGMPQAEMVPAGYDFVTASGIFIEKSDFFKIREISAHYTLPTAWIGRPVTLSASVRNVLIFCPATDLDPELNGVRSARDVDVGGISMFTQSPPRQIRFGVLFEL